MSVVYHRNHLGAIAMEFAQHGFPAGFIAAQFNARGYVHPYPGIRWWKPRHVRRMLKKQRHYVQIGPNFTVFLGARVVAACTSIDAAMAALKLMARRS